MSFRLAPPQSELRRLGPCGEPERDEGRPEPGGDVHRRARAPVDPCVVAGEEGVEAARLEAVKDARIVANEDREIRLAAEAIRVQPWPAAQNELRVRTC